MEIIGYFALVGIGVILGVIGGGGSLLSVPILVYLFALDIVTASSYSLFIVGTTSLFGVWLKQKEQRIDIRSGLIFAGCSVLAIFITRQLILPGIPDEILVYNTYSLTKRGMMLSVFALLAIASSLIMLLRCNWSSKRIQILRFENLILIPVGFATGMLVGFVGVGGGFLILPSLIIFARLPFKMAVSTTLLVIALNSLLGFLGDAMSFPINWFFLLLITCLAAIGMFIGNVSSRKISVQHLRLSFGWCMLVVGISILVRELIL